MQNELKAPNKKGIWSVWDGRRWYPVMIRSEAEAVKCANPDHHPWLFAADIPDPPRKAAKDAPSWRWVFGMKSKFNIGGKVWRYIGVGEHGGDWFCSDGFSSNDLNYRQILERNAAPDFEDENTRTLAIVDLERLSGLPHWYARVGEGVHYVRKCGHAAPIDRTSSAAEAFALAYWGISE